MGFFPSSTFTVPLPILAPTIAKCGACGLFKGCHSPKMKPTGKGRLRVLVVGEAPGASEDEQGKQFVGKAGQFLRGLFTGLGVDLDDCWITNAAICRPPANELDEKVIEYCRPNLLSTIRALKPNVIILLGGSAVKSLIGIEWGGPIKEISRWVGWQIPSQIHGAWLCPTFHPSYVLREGENPVLVKMVRQHIKRALALEKVPVPKYDLEAARKKVQAIMEPEVGNIKMAWLAEQEGFLAFDYETDRKKPEHPNARIVCASFCLNGERTFSTAITPESYPALRAVVTAPKLKKIGSNIKFEERWSIQKLGCGV